MNNLIIVKDDLEQELAAHIESMNVTELARTRRPWSYYYAARQFLSFLEKRKLGLLDGLTAYVTDLENESLKASTFNHRLAAAKSIIRHAIDTRTRMAVEARAGLIALLDAAKPRKIASGALEVHDNKYLTEDEVGTFLSRCSDASVFWMAKLLYTTGARCSEMLDIRLDDIEPAHRGIRDVTLRGKGRKDRVTSIENELYLSILEHFGGSTWLFEHNGKQYSASSVTNRFKSVGWQTLGRKVGPHMLRHSFGTILYERTHDLVGVQRALGHANSSTTSSMYVHSSLGREARILHLPTGAESEQSAVAM